MDRKGMPSETLIRQDISERIVFKCKPINEDPTIPLSIDDTTYYIQPIIYHWRKPRPTRYSPNPPWSASNELCSYDLENLAKKPSWITPQITQKKLRKLLGDAIKRGDYRVLSERSSTILIGLTNRSLENLDQKKEWFAVNHTQIMKSIKNQSQ